MTRSLKRRLAHVAARRFAQRSAPVFLDRAVVSFSFDDFPKSAATTGARILEDRGLRGTFYATASNMGRVVNGVRQYDAEDLARLSERGHEIGCHSATHPWLARESEDRILTEFEANRDHLALLGHTKPLRTHAYPYGDVSPRVKRHAGRWFAASRGIWPGLNEGHIDLALLRCVSLEPHILARRSARDWIELAVRRKAWLIFLTHDVTEDHSRYGTDPGALAGVVDHAMAAGAAVLPVAEALDLALARPREPQAETRLEGLAEGRGVAAGGLAAGGLGTGGLGAGALPTVGAVPGGMARA